MNVSSYSNQIEYPSVLLQCIYSHHIPPKNAVIVKFDCNKLTAENFQILVNLSEMLQDSGEMGEMEYEIFKFHIKSLETYEKDLILVK